MSVQEYSLKFTKLSKYAPSLVSYPRDEMSHFVTGVFDDLLEECRLMMSPDNMYISRLIVHDQQVEEIMIKRKTTEFKKANSYEGGTSKGKMEIQDKPRFMKRISNLVPSNFPKAIKDRVSNARSKKERSGNSHSKKPTCTKCGKKHMDKCLVGTYNCFGCGKSVHKVRDCPNTKVQE